MNYRKRLSVLGFVVALLSTPPVTAIAQAQAPATEQNADRQIVVMITALRGEWLVSDPGRPVGLQPCKLNLISNGPRDKLPLTNEGCDGALKDAASWTIRAAQLAVSGKDGNTIAVLGGSELRLVGQTAAGASIEMERASALAARFAAGPQGCIYYGNTLTCARSSDIGSIDTSAGPVAMRTLVELNLRERPDSSASVRRVLPENACLSAARCGDSVSGLWCEVSFEGTSGWVRKHAMREGRWPVVTIVSGCVQPAS